jgi:alpha-2-macroglobulin
MPALFRECGGGTAIAERTAMHPYRLSPEPEPTDDRGKAARAAAYRASLVRMIVAGGALAVVLVSAPFVVRLLARRAPSAPPELLTAGAAFPVASADLAPSVPLAPLLAADAPEGLAVLDPTETALNLRPGEPITVRFNRPMVEGARVGKPVDAPVLALRPGVRGRTVWTSRSALSFEPAPSEWLRTHAVSMTLAPGVRSLAGEEAPEVDPRTVVFDAGPRLVRGPRAPRLVAGEAAAFEFSGNVDLGALRGQLLAYEVDGGRRTLPLRLTGHPRDAQGDTRVDVAFERLLEPGAQLAVALAPTLANGGGDRPRVFDLELAPRAKIEGIGCPADATQADQCEHQGPPGQVVDIEESLRLLSSVKVAPPPPDAVTVTPPLPHTTLTVEAETRLVLRGEWAPGQVYEVRLNGLADEDGHPLARTAPLAVRSSGQPPAVHTPAGRLAFESDARAELGMRGIHVDRGEVRLARVPEGDELAAVLAPGSWLEATGRDARTIPLLDVLPSARPNRWGNGVLPWGDGARASMVVLGLSADTKAEPPTQSSLTFAQQTDLGVDVKLLPRGARVWVTSVASAQPVPAARVTLADPNGAIVGDATTDAQGVAWVGSATSFVESVSAVRVVAGSDRAVLVVDSRSAIGPRHLGLSPGEQPPPAGAWVASVFTDRGIVRPGDTVHARAVVRVPEQDALHVPEEASAELLLFGPTGEMPLDRRSATLSAFGGIDADFRIDAAAGPGTFRVEVRREGETRAAGTASFVVAHYEPPALRVDLAPSATQLDDRDPLRMDVSASFTFGPAAVGMPGSWTLTTRSSGPSTPSRRSTHGRRAGRWRRARCCSTTRGARA